MGLYGLFSTHVFELRRHALLVARMISLIIRSRTYVIFMMFSRFTLFAWRANSLLDVEGCLE